MANNDEELATDLGKLLLEDGDATMDVTLKSEGEEIKVHKAILMARSPVFNRMFNTDMRESENNEITIVDTTINCSAREPINLHKLTFR